ncbi:transposase [Streptomyces sp. LN245]|uniref:transposase n=1 Tax=Streptomyces sp. LN245 TaxID=3112975 RepID=UPI00371D6051
MLVRAEVTKERSQHAGVGSGWRGGRGRGRGSHARAGRSCPRAREHPGFTKADFTPDWEARTLTCPRGVTGHPGKATRGDGHERLSVLFPKPACRVCEARQECTGTAEDRSRHIILLPQHLQEIQTRVRHEQDTVQWRQRYAIRAGCEATVSETVHAHGLRRCRYRGMAKTHVQHVLTAAGTNITRLSGHFPPDTFPPLSPVRPADSSDSAEP